MSIPLVIAGTTFNYPQSGQDPNWAEEASSWAVAVTEVLNTLLGPGDILQTSVAIEDGISVATNINGLLFDSGTVRAANVNYTIYRTSAGEPWGHAETGVLYLVFDDDESIGKKWSLTQGPKNGDAGVAFSIGDDGQIQYISTTIGIGGYSGTIRFSAKALTR